MRMSKALVCVGGALAAVGIVVLSWFTPSRDGYLEFFVGLPLAVTGVTLLGVGLVLMFRPR
jgi:hypothetical protein